MRFVLGMLVVGAALAATYFSIQSLGSTPPAAERGWVAPRRSDAGEVRRLEAAARRIEAQSPAILSLLVVHHGRLLLEKYFHGVDRSSDLDVYSITKSFTSTLTGIAIDRGEIRSVDQPIADFLPRRELAGADPRVRGITLRDLLTMRGGFPGDGDPRNGIGEVDDVTSALLHRPLVREPGTAFAYDTGSYYILSAVITHATGMPASEYARRHLLVPTGLKDVTWWRGLHGVSSGGTGIGSTARDMARFGELVPESRALERSTDRPEGLARARDTGEVVAGARTRLRFRLVDGDAQRSRCVRGGGLRRSGRRDRPAARPGLRDGDRHRGSAGGLGEGRVRPDRAGGAQQELRRGVARRSLPP